MKIMSIIKKSFIFLALILSTFLLIGCFSPKDEIISAPTNVAISNGVVTWNAVSDADGYTVIVGTTNHQVTATTFDLKTLTLGNGEYSVTVIARKGDKVSVPSQTVLYVVSSGDPDPDPDLATKALIHAETLLLVDPLYTMGRQRSSFPSDSAFRDYQRFDLLLGSYSEAAVDASMTSTQAIAMFAHMKDMPVRMDAMKSVSALIDELESYEPFGLTPTSMASVMMTVGMTAMDIMVNDTVDLILDIIVALQTETDLQRIVDYNDEKARLTIEHQLQAAALLAMQEEQALFLTNLENVIEYFMSVVDALPSTLITRLDGMMADEEEKTIVSMEEIFILKDEVVFVLQETLPSATDIADLYHLFMVIGAALGDLDISGIVTHAATLGVASHTYLDLLFTFADQVDLVLVGEVMVMVEQMQEDIDFEVMLDLVLFVGHYLESFVEDNQAKFDVLTVLDFETLFKDMLTFVFDLTLENLETFGSSPEEIDFFAWLFAEVTANFDVYVEGVDIVLGIGKDLINHFLSSEAVLFKDMHALFTSMDDQTNPFDLIADFEALLSGFIHYNDAIFDTLDQVTIQKLLTMGRIPMLVAFQQLLAVPLEDAENLFDALIVPISTALANVVTIERHVLATLDGMDIASLFDNTWTLDMQIEALAVAVIALDEILTPTIETMILVTVDILFDDILSNDFIGAMTDLSETQLDDMYVMITGMLNDTFVSIHEVADFNFGDLTEAELEQLLTIFAFMFAGEEENTEIDPVL